jgi:uncharacterized protein
MFREYGVYNVDLDITDKCNFGCSYCYHQKENTHIDEEVKRKSIEIIKKEGLIVTFFGGEPLVNFEGIVDVITNVNKNKWSVTSNLSLLDKNKKDFFINNNGKIHCSIDGTEKVHNLTRKYKNGNGTYKDVVKKIPLALEINPNDTARMTVIPEAAKYVYESVVSLHKLGFKTVAPMPVLEANWCESDFVDYDKSLQRLAEYNIEHPMFVIKPFYDVITRGFNFSKFNYHRCGAGYVTFAVSTDGNITPCHRFSIRNNEVFKDYVFGNILTGGVETKKVKKYRKHFSLNKIEQQECERCPHVLYCDRGCPNVSVLLHGVPNRIIPTQCQYVDIAAKHAKWLVTQIAHKKNKYLRSPQSGKICS